MTATSDGEEAAQTARGEFRTAIELVRDLAYPSWLPAEAKPAFEAVMAEVDAADQGPLATLSVMPRVTASGPWVDGVEVREQVDLRPGLHLLQYSSPQGIRSGWLSIAGAADVVLPGQVRGPILDQMSEAAGQSLVRALIEVAIEDLSVAYVSHRGGLWLISKTSGPVEISVIEPPEAAVPQAVAAETGRKKKNKKKRKNR